MSNTEQDSSGAKSLAILMAGVFFIFIDSIYGMHRSWVEYRNSHPIWFTVLKNSGATIKEVQHKHYTELETATWVRVQYDSTNVTEDFSLSNPIQADDYHVGARLRWVEPSQLQYERAGYSLPTYGWDGLYLIFAIFAIVAFIVILACLADL